MKIDNTIGVVMAAGLGTRLRPITNVIPKCLVKIGDKTLLDHWIESMISIGIESIIINTHYLADAVKTHLELKKFKCKIILSHEPNLLGSLGTLVDNLNEIKKFKSVLIVYGDNYFEGNFRKYYQTIDQNISTGYIFGFKSSYPEECGIIECDSSGKPIGFEEKPKVPKSPLANAGIYYFNVKFLQKQLSNVTVNPKVPIDIAHDLLSHIITWMEVVIFKETLHDVGTIKKYNALIKSLDFHG